MTDRTDTSNIIKAPRMHEEERDPTSSEQASVFDRLDDRLFRAWQSGDPAARTSAWEFLWAAMYTTAVLLCRHGAPDQHTAEEWATESVTDAWLDIEQKIAQGYPWRGAEGFSGHLNAYVVFHCRRRLKKYFRVQARIDHLLGVPDDEREARFESLAATPPAQGESDLASARTMEAIASIVTTLSALRSVCWSRKALVQLIDAMLLYVRESCVRAVDRADTDMMSLDDLILVMDPGLFDASPGDMNRFIMSRLRINRNTLDTRRADLRRYLDRLAPGQGSLDGAGRGSSLRVPS